MLRIFTIFIVSLILFIVPIAYGEDSDAYVPVAHLENNEEIIAPNALEGYRWGTQSCVVHIRVVTAQPDGSTVESVISPVAYNIRYKIAIHKSGGLYSAVQFVHADSPVLAKTSNSIYDLGLSLQKISQPDNISTSVPGDTWSITISGGSYQVTYNSTIYINANGQQTGAVPTTQTRAYYYTMSGP